ncbi:MAG: hypothetical protein Q7U47_04710 [Paludibacter sp.]|nr:hypothetical protein [Paludibacter sp.]
MTEEETKGIIRKNELLAKGKERKCFVDCCNSMTISSHLLQKNGILNRISHQNHLYEIGINPFNTPSFNFQKIGINKALTFPGFCNKHDTEIFREIETKSIDFKDYRTNLLFSYRILVNELRKKEILIDWYTENINNNELRTHITPDYFYRLNESINGYKMALNDGKYYLKYFNLDIYQNTKNFSFMTFELPFIEICASGVFNYENSCEIVLMPESQPLTDIYFNLLPMDNKSIVIFGVLTEMKNKCWDYIEDFAKGSKVFSLKKVSDLLLTNVENWLCSKSVYEKLKSNETVIVEEIKKTNQTNIERRTLDFNMFEYIDYKKNTFANTWYS